MDKKTLVEQLREIGNSTSSKSTCQRVFAILHDVEYCFSTPCNACTVWKDLADRIEAEYTPNSKIATKYMPYPLDSNGVPCFVCELMQDCHKTGFAEKPVKIIGVGGKNVFYQAADGSIKAHVAANMHHVEPPKPLTKEDIDALAKIDYTEYWGCEGALCSECPSKIGGKTPFQKYGTYTDKTYHSHGCKQAMTLDILRKERERVAVEQ